MGLRSWILRLVDFGIEIGICSDREWSCQRKVRYGHHETAERVAVIMGGKTGDKLEAYQCRYCDGWHIGHAR